MSKGKFALGALFGAVVGATVALLTAPKSGKETRAELVKKAEEMRVEAEKTAKIVKEATMSKVDQAAKKTGQVKSDLEAQAKDLQRRTESAVKGAKEGFANPSK